MTSPTFEGGKADYIESRSATKMNFGEIKVLSKTIKIRIFEINKFDNFGLIWYLISL